MHIPTIKIPTVRYMVIMLSPLILRMLIYIFLLLSITITILYDLFGKISQKLIYIIKVVQFLLFFPGRPA